MHLDRFVKWERQTAQRVVSRWQAVLLTLAVVGTICGLVLNHHRVIISLIAASMAFWLCFVGFKLLLWAAAERYDYPRTNLFAIGGDELPVYTVLIPLYKEGKMLPELVKAMSELKYPKDKLQVQLLLEHDDKETLSALSRLVLPYFVDVVRIPSGGPRTKPNALNFGLAKAKGKFLVIFDAEDRPEPDQLMKSVAAFHQASPDVVCLQARLAFWNISSTWVSRFYWAEYITHFEWTMAGLTKLGIVPPLGGTSNHFRTIALREVTIDPDRLPFCEDYIGGWDPYNVTEDAELGAALAAQGYRVEMLDSTTWEEAPNYLRQADKQRRRWLKGYAQTGLVYIRRPIRTIRRMGLKNWFCFNLLMLGTPLSLLLNLPFWGTTVVYFATRTTVIEQLFPLPLFYVGLMLMVIGNLLLFYQMVAACLRREGYGAVKYMLLLPVWWLFTTWSAYMMVYELFFRTHHWHKTEHGLNINYEELEEPRQIASERTAT